MPRVYDRLRVPVHVLRDSVARHANELSGQIRQIVTGIFQDVGYVFMHLVTPFRNNQTELGQQATQLIDQAGTLANPALTEKLTQRQYGLLFSRVTGTTRISGRVTASQMAAASLLWFLRPVR